MASSAVQPLSLKSTLQQLLLETIENKSPKGVLRLGVGKNRNVTFVCIISDEDGYMRAMQAYEEGRDEFAARVANAVLDSVRANGIPEKNSDLKLHLHS
jgi:phosphotransferase system HPr-like phosphotransfer protein